MDNKLILLDAYAIIYRSYYALIRAPRINSKGLNTSAVMGFCNTLNEVLQKMQPTHVAVAFDHGKTFRHEMFPAYKAQREETPEDIRLSVPIIKDILAAYRIPVLQVDGYEADDVIGTVAHHGASDGMDVFMLTPDKDYAQLVTDRIHILRPRHGGGYEDMGPREVTEKYGLNDTSQVIDLLGLMGDASDNYPGCPGVGEKTAAKLIGEFGSIEGLLARTSEIKGKLREKVEGAVDDIIMSRKLATIRTDVPMTIDLDAMKVHEPDLERLKQLFDELEFKTFADKLLGTSNTQSQQKTAKTKKSSKKQTDVNFQPSFFEEFEAEGTGSFKFSTREDESEPVSNIQTHENVEDALQFLHKISTYEKINSSVEGDQKSGIDAKMTGIALGADEETTAYIPLPPTLPRRDDIIKKNSVLTREELLFLCERKIIQHFAEFYEHIYRCLVFLKHLFVFNCADDCRKHIYCFLHHLLFFRFFRRLRGFYFLNDTLRNPCFCRSFCRICRKLCRAHCLFCGEVHFFGNFVKLRVVLVRISRRFCRNIGQRLFWRLGQFFLWLRRRLVRWGLL